MIEKSIYVAGELADEAARPLRFASLAAVSPSGTWFYAEVTDLNAAQCSRRVREEVIPQMRKVTDTVFVRSSHLGRAFARWLEQNMPHDGSRIDVLSLGAELVDADALRCLLSGHDALGQRLRDARIETDQVALQAGLTRCGGERKVGASAIVRAVLAAVTDEGRTEPIGALHTRRFELLMGARGATSLRAWIRRHEKTRRLPGCEEAMLRRASAHCGSGFQGGAVAVV